MSISRMRRHRHVTSHIADVADGGRPLARLDLSHLSPLLLALTSSLSTHRFGLRVLVALCLRVFLLGLFVTITFDHHGGRRRLLSSAHHGIGHPFLLRKFSGPCDQLFPSRHQSPWRCSAEKVAVNLNNEWQHLIVRVHTSTTFSGKRTAFSRFW